MWGVLLPGREVDDPVAANADAGTAAGLCALIPSFPRTALKKHRAVRQACALKVATAVRKDWAKHGRVTAFPPFRNRTAEIWAFTSQLCRWHHDGCGTEVILNAAEWAAP